ncbi:ATP phosphoribosyltransferase [Patescibacteria group bacterium]|nr:ATP phosphoribosyltransferase [Patescibacteria group bacterium]
MNEQETKLRIAVQKSGRLSNGSQDLLRACGLNFEFQGKQLMASVSNFPLDILLLKNGDVLTCVEEGAADLGIIGEDLVEEYQPNVNILARLGFGRCRFTVGVPQNTTITDLSQLSGAVIATSFPRITCNRLAELGVNVQTKKQNGSVEIAPYIYPNVAAIADITESGDTMRDNGIRELQDLQKFESILIANPASYSQKGSRRIMDRLNFRIRRVQAGINLSDIKPILPEVKLDFSKLKDPVNDVFVVPANIKDTETEKDFMQGFMDTEAYYLSRLLGEVVFWSRTRGELWLKGEKSGNRLFIQRWETDCDNDALRVFIKTPFEPICHRGTVSCFDQI